MACKQTAMFRCEVVVFALCALAAFAASGEPAGYNQVIVDVKSTRKSAVEKGVMTVGFNDYLENLFNNFRQRQYQTQDKLPFGSHHHPCKHPHFPETQESTSEATPRTVNERFPAAVLFGRTCGGTIISENWILTAAHCTIFTGGRDVLAGTSNSGDGSGVRRTVKRLVVHPLFSVGPYWLNAERFGIKQVAARYDFMLAELDKPLPLNGRTIAAANLDGPDFITDGLTVGYAGYGAEHHGETMRHDMHGMSMQTLSEAECSRLRQFNNEDMICARGLPPRYDSACNGDSGSGLMHGNRLIGVASWVENDAFECRNGSMVVFARVPIARQWIKEVAKI